MIVACVGCSRRSGIVENEVLSQKLNMVLSNQVVLNAKLNALPSGQELNAMAYFYHTNSMAVSLFNYTNCVALGWLNFMATTSNISALHEEIDAQFKLANELRAVNESQRAEDYYGMLKELRNIQNNTDVVLFMLTNGPLVDIGYTRFKIDDVGRDARLIKVRLGIIE